MSELAARGRHFAPEFLDARRHAPPKGATLVLLSSYGVVSVGPFVPGFHVAWLPLPRAPGSLRGTEPLPA